MTNISLPDMSLVWASNGDVLKPTDNKIQNGWTAEIPPRQWFNWLDQRQDQAIAHIAQHGIAVWNSNTEYQAGISYIQGSDGIIYKALQTNTNQNPVSTTGYWLAGATGSLLNVQKFTTSGSYAPTINTRYIIVEVVGGGGGGGGTGATNASQYAPGVGGAGGGYAKAMLKSGFSPPVNITVGAGGLGVVGSSGATGASSSFGNAVSATGGAGGGLTTAFNNIGAISAGSPAVGIGAVASSPNIISLKTSRGGIGGNGIGFSTGNFVSGYGGSSYYGQGGLPGGISASGTGGSGANYGSGGGGAGATINTAALAGGNGAAGFVIVWEFS